MIHKYLFLVLIIIFSCQSKNEEKIDESLSESEIETIDLKGFYKAAPATKKVYDKLNFGNGYNSVTGKEHFGVMHYDGAEVSTETIANALGNSGFVRMHILEDKESLKKALNINVKVDLDFKVGNFSSDNSAKVNLYRETKFNSFSQHALLKSEYTNEPKVMLNPRVRDEWIALAKENPDEFMRTCGDMFVSRIYTGGSMYALFSMHGRDEYEKAQNDAFLKSTNNYLGNKLTVEASVGTVAETMKSVSNIDSEVITEGGGNTPTTANLEAYIDYANTFKTQVGTDGRPIILYVELSPYESIAGFPKEVDFSKIRVVQQGFLQSSSSYYNDVETNIANAEFVKNNSDFFENTDIKLAEKMKDSIIAPIKARLSGLIARCESDFNDCDYEGLSLLFEEFQIFDPEMDYSEFVGADIDLPITIDDYIMVCPDTGEGKKITILGKLESRFRDNDSKVSCKDVSFKSGRVSRLNMKGYNYYFNLVEYWERPYYKIKYTSTETNETLREFAWNGDPFITEKNVRIDIKLVNPISRLQWTYDFNNKKSQKTWVDVGKKIESKYGFKREPRFGKIRSCNGKAPYVTISEPNAKPEDLKTATRSKTYPKTIFKGKYITYKYSDKGLKFK